MAISSYLLGLLGYAAKGLEGLGLALDPGPLAALGVAVVVPVVWGGVRHLRHAAAPPPAPEKPGPGLKGLLARLARRRDGLPAAEAGPGEAR